MCSSDLGHFAFKKSVLYNASSGVKQFAYLVHEHLEAGELPDLAFQSPATVSGPALSCSISQLSIVHLANNFPRFSSDWVSGKRGLHLLKGRECECLFALRTWKGESTRGPGIKSKCTT